MTDRPIIFSAPMVKALLSGSKTQTRRILKPQPEYRGGCGNEADPEEWGWEDDMGDHVSVLDIKPNKYAVGDRLWVRENWWHVCAADGPTVAEPGDSMGRDGAFFRADHPDYPPCPHYRFRFSIHMPRWASRLTLAITDVRVQRLQEISEEDARDEGAAKLVHDGDGAFFESEQGTYRTGFAGLWDHINGSGAWDASPWIVALTFTVERRNIDEVPAQTSQRAA